MHRGKWVLESIFGKSPPPPPANVKPIEPTPATQPKATLRVKLDAHKSDANCAACHRKIDPLGLAFDNYDAIGRWRTEEVVSDGSGDNPKVDASGELPDGRKFADAAGFKKLLLADLDKFNAAFVDKLATFALRRAMTFDDRDALAEDRRAEQGRRLPACRHRRSARALRPVPERSTEPELPNPTGTPTDEQYPDPKLAPEPPALPARRRRGGGPAAAELHDAAAGRGRGPAKPRRSVFVYIPNGVNVLTWQITKAGRDYKLSEPLKPLEKHRANITPISGLHHPTASARPTCARRSGSPAAKISQEGGAYHNTVSCDQFMAEVTSPNTRFGSLELSISARPTTTLAWSRDGVPLPAEDNPRNVFNRLFGEEPGGIDAQRRQSRSPPERARRRARRCPVRSGRTSAATTAPSSTSICTPCATWRCAPSGSTPG